MLGRFPARFLLRLAILAAVLISAVGESLAATDGGAEISTVRYARQSFAEPSLIAGQSNLSGPRFRADPRQAPSFGVSADRWWALIDLHPHTPDPLFLGMEAPAADRVQAFACCGGGPWSELGRMKARYAVFETAVSGRDCQGAFLQESRGPIRFGIQALDPDMLAASEDTTLSGLALGVVPPSQVRAVCGSIMPASRPTKRCRDRCRYSYTNGTRSVPLGGSVFSGRQLPRKSGAVARLVVLEPARLAAK